VSIELDFDVTPEALEPTNKPRVEWTEAIPPQVTNWVQEALADRVRHSLKVKSPAQRAGYDAVIRAALLALVPDGSLEINPRDIVDGETVTHYTYKVVAKRKAAVRKPKTAVAE
jgi:hypothetical protein